VLINPSIIVRATETHESGSKPGNPVLINPGIYAGVRQTLQPRALAQGALMGINLGTSFL
jgi:hypothetical protein